MLTVDISRYSFNIYFTSSLKGDRSAKSTGVYGVRVHEEPWGRKKEINVAGFRSSHPEWYVDASFPTWTEFRRFSLADSNEEVDVAIMQIKITKILGFVKNFYEFLV